MSAIHYRVLRFLTILKKELIFIKRDYATYILLVAIPLIQTSLFAYILNTDPKNLSTIVIAKDTSNLTNQIIQCFANTGYFKIEDVTQDENKAAQLMAEGKIQFIINIPPQFTRDLIRKEKPHILLEGDATDPVAAVNAFNAGKSIPNYALKQEMNGPLHYLEQSEPLFVVDTHGKYNPALLPMYHNLPGLITIILTTTLTALTAMMITGEYEYGTMEVLLITPLKPIELILGKIIPYMLLGFTIFFLILIMNFFFFKVPFLGSIFVLTVAVFFYIAATLATGLMISTLSRTQFRAINIVQSYNLPVILLSGFLFPFYAMPTWAQWLGNLMPPTHFLRIGLSVMLKGSGFFEIWPDLWPILLFIVCVVSLSIISFRKTLD